MRKPQIYFKINDVILCETPGPHLLSHTVTVLCSELLDRFHKGVCEFVTVSFHPLGVDGRINL